MSDSAWQLFFDGLRNLLSILLAEFFILIPTKEKKGIFWLRVLISLVAVVVLCFIYSLIYSYGTDAIRIVSIFWYVFVASFTGLIIYFCFKVNYTETVWLMIAAYALHHMIYVAIKEIVYEGLMNQSISYWYMFLMYFTACAFLYPLFYLLFKRGMKNYSTFTFNDTWKSRLTFSIMLVVFLFATMLSQAITVDGKDGSFNYLAACSDFLFCAFVFTLQFVMLSLAQRNSERAFYKMMFEEEKKQYESFQESVDYINVKVHDLKHQIGLMENGSMSSERINEMTDSIALYEAFAKTGSDNLDAVLTQKNLTCLKEKITLTYIADGESIDKMDAEDVYTLFGNLMDNAINYVKTLEDIDKRFIKMSIRKVGDKTHIHFENYFEGKLEFENGLPKTTNRDNTIHGFGVRSISATAKKYKGTTVMETRDGLFITDIFLSL